MKKFLALCLCLACASLIKAQPKPQDKPFVLQGKLGNCTDKDITLSYEKDKVMQYKTIPVNSDGSFESTVAGPVEPQKAWLFLKGTQVRSALFIAPGYQLHIVADCSNYTTFRTTVQIMGAGAAANQYLFRIDSIKCVRNDTATWWRLKGEQLLTYANRQQHTADSVLKLPPAAHAAADPYYSLFKKQMMYSVLAERIEYLITATLDDTSSTAAEGKAFLVNHMDPAVMRNLYADEYLTSDVYRKLMFNDFYQYLLALERKRNHTTYQLPEFNLRSLALINSEYKGKVRLMALYKRLESIIEYSRSFEELALYKKEAPKYIQLLPDTNQIRRIKEAFKRQEDVLTQIQIGRPAPDFTAADSSGKAFKLADFKGKVVLIDLWASWCAPCRYQTPYLQKIVQKYQQDGRITFISVAVGDKYKAWQNALKQDKPTWLQLYDNEGQVGIRYVANSIPKFVLVNKQGNIVTFDAPSPSEPQLEALLLAEMGK